MDNKNKRKVAEGEYRRRTSILTSDVDRLVRKVGVMGVVFLIVLGMSFTPSQINNIPSALAATYTFTQTDWSGGETATTAVHPTNQTSWTYASTTDSQIATSTVGQLSLKTTASSTTHTSDGDFGGGTIASSTVSGNSVKLAPSGIDIGTGVDGDCVISSINTDTKGSAANPYNCRTVTINNPGRISGTQPLVIKSWGDVTINGTLSVDGNAASGATKGGAVAGGNDGGNADVIGAGSGGGGIGGGCTYGDSGGGGGGGYGVVGGRGGYESPITCGGSPGAQNSDTAGSGGGGGRTQFGKSGGGGGGGGGSITILSGGDITVAVSSIITSNGGNGGNGFTGGSGYVGGGGGGGSGGNITLRAINIINSGITRVNGGTGGVGGSSTDFGGGGGGGGGGGKVIIQDANSAVSGNAPTLSAGGGGSGGYGYNGSAGSANTVSGSATVYSISGDYTSGAIDLGQKSFFTTLDYTKITNASTTLTVDIRAGTDNTPDDGGWTSWQTNVADLGDISGLNGNQYVQYRVNLSTIDTAYTPSLDDITVNYQYYPTASSYSLISSGYNSSDSSNKMAGISWSQTLPSASTTVVVSLRTASTYADLASASWTDFSTTTSGTITYTSADLPAGMKDQQNDQWWQYKVTFSTTNGSQTPIVDNVQISYDFFVCDSGSVHTTCYINTSKTISNGETISGNGNLVIQSGGNLTASAGNIFNINMAGNVTIENGGQITGNFQATSTDFMVNTGGSINVNSKGCAGGAVDVSGYGGGASCAQGGTGAGVGNNTYGGGGGGHGGGGGTGGAGGAGGATYDSTNQPVLLGSGGGGGSGTAGGVGGGAVKIIASGTITINGAISANGSNGTNTSGSGTDTGGGGSGGSVWIQAGTLAGSQALTANGGAGGYSTYTGSGGVYTGGGGGGGRIALYYNSSTYGGTLSVSGAAGGTRNGSVGSVGATGSGGTIYQENTTSNTATLIAGGDITSSNTNFSKITQITVDSGSTASFNSFSTSTENFPALITLTVNGTLTHSAGSYLVFDATTAPVLQTVTINSGGSINVSGKGCAGGAFDANGQGGGSSCSVGGIGAGTSNNSYGGGGGGYGGEGGDTVALINGGAAYGSITQPIFLGSGGGGSKSTSGAGGSSGGAVKIITSGTITINGTISANGNAATNLNSANADTGGGGSGGSIWIEANTVTTTAGTPSITVDGGKGGNNANGGTLQYTGGGGAGGRIALYYVTSSFTGTFAATGGVGGTNSGSGGTGRAGGEGTVYIKDTSRNAMIATWNATSTASWSAASSWNSGTVPTSADDAIFNSASTQNATVDTSFAGTVGNLNIGSGYTGTITLAKNLVINGNATSTAGIFNANGYTTNVAGITTINGGTYQASTTAQTFTGGLTVSSGTFTGSSGAVNASSTVALSGGTFTAPSGNLNLGGNFNYTGGTFDHNNGTVIYSSSTSQIITSLTYNNLTLSGSGTKTLGGNATTTGNLTINSGATLDGGSYNLTMQGGGSSLINNGTFTANTGTITFSTTTAQTIPGLTYNNLILSGSGTKTLGGNATTTGNFTINSGATLDGSAALYAYGNWTDNGGTHNGTNTVIFASSSNQAISGAAATSTFYNLRKSIGGALVAPSSALNVKGNLTLDSGTSFTHNSGTVDFSNNTLNSTSTISIPSGSTITFYALTKAETATTTLAFTANATTTIANNLSLSGVPTGKLFLRSSADGTPWKIDAQGTRTMSNLDVKDSNNVNAASMNCLDGCDDSTGNTNWKFGQAGEFDPTFDGDGVSVYQATSSDPTNWGKVKIQYKIKDLAVVPAGGWVTPSFSYSTSSGATWTNISSTYLASGDLDDKTSASTPAFSNSEWATYSATWDAQSQIPDFYYTTALIRATISDGDKPANAAVDATSTIAVLDTNEPGLGSATLKANASSTSPLTVANTAITLSLQNITGDDNSEVIYAQFASGTSPTVWYGANSTSSLAAAGTWGSGFSVASSTDGSITWPWTMSSTTETINVRLRDSFNNNQATTDTIQVQNTAAPGITTDTLKINNSASIVDIATSTAPTVSLSLQGITGDASNETIYIQFASGTSPTVWRGANYNGSLAAAGDWGGGFTVASSSEPTWSWDVVSRNETINIRVKDNFGNVQQTTDINNVRWNLVPEFQQAISAWQIATTTDSNWGKIQIQYSIRDTDTNLSENASPGPGANFSKVKFEYSTSSSPTWTAIATSTITTAEGSDVWLGEYLKKAVQTSAYNSYTAYWNALSQIPETYSTTTQIRVTVDDGEPVYNTASSTNSNFTISTTKPTLNTSTLLINDSPNSVNATTSAITLKLQNISGDISSETIYVEFASSSTWYGANANGTLATSTLGTGFTVASSTTFSWPWTLQARSETITVRIRDAYNNQAVSTDTNAAGWNNTPEFQNTITSSQITNNADADWGKVKVDYIVRDRDTSQNSSSTMQTFAQISLQYSTGTPFTTWTNISRTYLTGATGTEVSATVGKISISESYPGASSTIYWNAAGQLGSYAGNARVRVTIDDTETIFNSASSTSATISNLDAERPSFNSFTAGTVETNNIQFTDSDGDGVADNRNVTLRFANLVESSSSTQGVYVLFSNDGTNYGTSTNSTTGNLIATSTQSNINQWLYISGANVGTATTSWTLLQSGSRSKTVYALVKDAYGNDIASAASASVTWNKRPQFSAGTISDADNSNYLSASSTSGVMIRQCDVYDTDASCSAGKVKLIYAPRDPDANESGLATKGQLSTTFDYSTDGANWTPISALTATTTVATSSADVAGGYNPIYSTTTAYWNASALGSQNNLRVRVTVNDNEGGSSATASSTSNIINNYDQTNPSGSNITFDAGVAGTSTANAITIPWLDDANNATNTVQYVITDTSTNSSPVNTGWTTVAKNATSTLNWTFDSEIEVKSLKFQYRDIYGNTTATTTVYTVAPIDPATFLIQDVSKVSLGQYRMYIGWGASTSTDFQHYQLEYATSSTGADGSWGAFQLLPSQPITSSSTSYYVHDNLTFNVYYSYRVGVKSKNGIYDQNITVRSVSYGQNANGALYGRANGTQDGNEGGGGTVVAASKVENVVPTQGADKNLAVTYKLTDSNSDSKVNGYEAYLFYNTGVTLPTNAFNSGAGTLAVSDASKMATSGYIQINNEVLKYTGKSGNTLTGINSSNRGTWPTAGTTRATRQNASSTAFFEGTPVWIAATSTSPVSLSGVATSTIAAGYSGTTTWSTYYETALAGSSFTNVGIRVLVHDGRTALEGPLSSQSDYSEIGILGALDLTVPTIQFSATSTSGAESATSTSLSLVLSRAYPYNATVNYAVSASSTASGSGTDYTLANGTATVTAGATSTSITLLIADEALNEPDETVIVTLSSPANSSLGANTTYTYTILNDDALPTVGFTATSSSASESATPANFVVSLSAATGRDVTVNFSVAASSTATGGVDYSATSSSVTIPAGSLYATGTATIVDDGAVENNETLILEIASVTNATTSGAILSHTYTISDNDSAPIVGFATSTASSSEAASPVTLSFTLAAASVNPVTINYSVSGGTATGNGTDYSTTSNSVVILAGSTATSTTFTVTPDALDENDETIIFSIGSVTNATTTGGIGAYTYTILDDDALPVISFALATSSASEASSTASITFSLSATSSKDVTANFSLSGTATGTDYSFATTTVTIPAGSVSTSTVATIAPDVLNENDETIILTLASPTNATTTGAANATHTLTITDDDSLPTVGFASSTYSGSEASSTVNLLIQLSATSSKDVTVGYAVSTATSTASSGVDYVASNGTTTISAGSISTSVTVATVINDTLNEASETIVAALSSPTNSALSATSTHTYTILDDENQITVQFLTTSSSEFENSGSTNIGIVLSSVSSQDVTINYSVSGGTATGGGTDYATTSNSVVIPAGSTATSTIITLNNESLVEGNETVILQIGSIVNASAGANTTHTLTIIDDETTPASAIVSSVVPTQGTDGNITVNYTLTDGSFGTKVTPSYEAYVLYDIGVALTSSSTNTLILSDTTKLPLTNGYIQINQEVIKYTSNATSTGTLSGITRGTWPTFVSSGRATRVNTVMASSTSVWIMATSTGASVSGSISTGYSTSTIWNPRTDSALNGNYLSGVSIRVLAHDNQSAGSGPISSQSDSSVDSTLAILDLKAPVIGTSSLLINGSASSVENASSTAALSLTGVSGDTSSETIYIQFATSSNWFGALSGGAISATSSDWGDTASIGGNLGPWTWPLSGRSETVSVRMKDAYGNVSNTDTNSILKNAVPEFYGSISDSDASGYATTTNNNIVIRQCNIYDTDPFCTAGKVKVKFLARDSDTAQGVTTPGYINTEFSFSLNGNTYATSAVATYSATGTNALASNTPAGKSAVDSDGATYTTVTAYYYNPDIANSVTLAARVSVTDNENGTTPVTVTSNVINYDKTAPSGSLTFDAGIAGGSVTAVITIPVPIDTNAVQYKLIDDLAGTYPSGTSTAWTSFASTTSAVWTFDSDIEGKVLNYLFRDVYGNQSGTGTASSLVPPTGSSFTVDDISTGSNKRIYVSWTAATSSDFAMYRLEYATSSDGNTYTNYFELVTLSSISTNYYTHAGLDSSVWYRYRLSVKNSAGNYSVKTLKNSNSYITAKPDGVLNGDESSADDRTEPTVTTVSPSTILATSATIRFDTYDAAASQLNSAVYYAASSDYNASASSTRSKYTNISAPKYISTGTVGSSTTAYIIITGLTKNTLYKYAVEVCDTTGNCKFKEQSDGTPYELTTASGPAITSASIVPSNGATIATYDSAAITWSTDLPADSQVFYSASTSDSALVNPVTAGSTTQVSGDQHSVGLSALSSNATYYYKVRSTDRNSASPSYLQYDESPVRSFITAAIPVPTMTVAPSCSVTESSITVNWTTDQDTTTEISVLSANVGGNYFNSTAGAQINQYPSVSLTIDSAAWTSWRSTTDYGKNHSQTFTGLTESTTYYVQARSLNRSSGETSGLLNCKTTAKEVIVSRPAVQIQDVTPPIISIVAIQEVTADAVVIAWGTDELADSLVEYGPTMNYGALSGKMKELVSAHSVTLSGLKPATNYNFKVSSADVKGNRSYAGDQSFTTMSMEEESLMAKDELEELKKQLEELKEKAESDAKKAATLQEAAKRFKEILKTISSDVSLQDLEELTTDISDTIEDITQQVIPPAIIGGVPSIEVGSDKATIKWRTNKPSSSLVALASEVDYNPKVQDPYVVQVGQPNEEVADHVVVIPNLQSDTVYHFQIRSKAKVGPEGRSKDFVFETLPELPQIVDYSFKRITENSITVTWKTNTLTTSLVRYTPLVNNQLQENESKTQGKPDFVKDHEVTVSNLPANANYLIEISSSDVTGATASRTIGTVKTAIDVKAPVINKVRSESTLFPGKTERTQTIIYWETDEPSSSQIFWKEGVGKGDFPNSTPIDKELTTSHVIVITTFKPGMVYRFQVESIDPTGNKTRSSDYTVLTPRKGETVIDLIITNFEDIFGFLKKL